jgi:hypothetical protein
MLGLAMRLAKGGCIPGQVLPDRRINDMQVGTRLCRVGVEGAYEAAGEILDVLWAHRKPPFTKHRAMRNNADDSGIFLWMVNMQINQEAEPQFIRGLSSLDLCQGESSQPNSFSQSCRIRLFYIPAPSPCNLVS